MTLGSLEQCRSLVQRLVVGAGDDKLSITSQTGWQWSALKASRLNDNQHRFIAFVVNERLNWRSQARAVMSGRWNSIGGSTTKLVLWCCGLLGDESIQRYGRPHAFYWQHAAPDQRILKRRWLQRGIDLCSLYSQWLLVVLNRRLFVRWCLQGQQWLVQRMR